MVKTLKLPVDVYIDKNPYSLFRHVKKARLIVRERKGYESKTYLYLVYRDGKKIKEHYIARLF